MDRLVEYYQQGSHGEVLQVVSNHHGALQNLGLWGSKAASEAHIERSKNKVLLAVFIRRLSLTVPLPRCLTAPGAYFRHVAYPYLNPYPNKLPHK